MMASEEQHTESAGRVSGGCERHLVIYPDAVADLPLRYYGNIGYYAAMAVCGHATLGTDALYDKRHKSVHRCVIADASGSLQLTVPVAKPHGVTNARWTDVALSDHGAWWNVHRTSLESAYGRTPYFEFYIDRFLPFLTAEVMDRYPTIADLDTAIDAVVREILLIETSVSSGGTSTGAILPAESYTLPPYYQVRAMQQGFLPGMSILDLIFNLGPEAALYLRELCTQRQISGFYP